MAITLPMAVLLALNLFRRLRYLQGNAGREHHPTSSHDNASP